ncbi:MAG: hypothetical protein Kow0090_23200 [Myxococcota bacterium]
MNRSIKPLLILILLSGIIAESCVHRKELSELKAEFAAKQGFAMEEELAASPQALYKRALFLRDNGFYAASIKDLSALIAVTSEGREGMFPKREKAHTLLLQANEELQAFFLSSFCELADTSRARFNLAEAQELISASLEESPEDNIEAKKLYSRAKILEARLAGFERKCKSPLDTSQLSPVGR